MLKRDFMTSILLILTSLTIFLLLRLFVFSTYTVEEKDANTYIKAGDYMIIVKEEQPDYGDLVLYQEDGKHYVGRIMAKGGDQATFVEDVFYRNQEAVVQTYLQHLERAYVSDFTNDLPFTDDFSLDDLMNQTNARIPEDNYLILNDNRQNRADSRQFGLIPRSKIDGVLTFRLFPLKTFGFLIAD